MALIPSSPIIIASFLLFLLNQKLLIANGQYMVEILERTALGGHRAVVRCDATGANFGEDVVAFSFGMHAIGCAMIAEPPMACSNVEKPELNATTQCIVDFAVVPRGNCSFSEKAYYVQSAKPTGYSALILYNNKGQSPIPMSGSKYAELIQIPVVMVKYECMQSMLGHYSAENGYLVTIKSSPGYYDLVKYLFPFVIIVGICFVVLFISLMIRLCRERRRLARKRLPRSYLKKIPTKKYRKGDPEETCAICLEDFQESEKLRILPCKHAYHCKCIDPWLTKNRKVCPVCKRRVGPRSEDSSDSDDMDTERTTRSSTDGAGSSIALSLATTTHDNDPLLRNAQPMATSSSSHHNIPPYPPQHSAQHQMATTSSAASNGHSPFVRARLHLSNFFLLSRCEQNVNNAQNSTTAGNSALATISDGNQILHPSNGFEDLHAASQNAAASEDNSNTNAFGRLRNGINGIGNRLSELIRRGPSAQNNPHLLLENEEDSSSMTREELDTLSRRTCETLDEITNTNSSLDGHSMTTMHSNRNLVSTAVALDSDTAMPNQNGDNVHPNLTEAAENHHQPTIIDGDGNEEEERSSSNPTIMVAK